MVMRKRSVVGVAAILTTLLTGYGLSPASADVNPDPVISHPSSATVSGKKLVRKDGLEVVTETYKVNPGSDPINVTYADAPSGISTFAVWGTSYATSSEIVQLYYQGKAKAAGNIYSGKRIVQVCIWYNQAGIKTDKVCSTANSSGSSWIAGPEKKVGMWDNLSINWPQTEFNIQTTRIATNIF